MNLKVSQKTSQLHIDGKIIDDDKDIATRFNTFFSKVGPTTEENIPKVPNIPPSKDQNRITFVVAHVSMEEVLDIINLLQNKSSGPYSIPFKLLMLIPELLIQDSRLYFSTKITSTIRHTEYRYIINYQK